MTDKSPFLNALPDRPGTVRVIPLGGLGEIGMNCMLIESEGEMILVDCGQMMPGDDLLGVDYVIPDVSFVEAHKHRLKAILITHAHEDHVGALPYVLPKLPPGIPLFASEFTIALLREKFEEHDLAPIFRKFESRRAFKVGKAFEVEPIAVTHSLVDSFAFAIRTSAGVLIHSGDFKIDPAAPDGVTFDHYAFARYAEEPDGVLMLMSDSTNVDRPGSCPSESEVIPKLTQLIREAPQAIILGCFASSLHRIQNVLNIAAACGRVVFAAGLNMERNIRIAAEHGYLELPGDLRDDLRSVESVPRQKRLILTTGSQGEPLAGLSRMAMGTHKFVQVQPGDRVILSTRLIPGNERSIYSMINNFARRGADVYDERSTPGIHVSGHAYRDDLRHLINLTTPQYLVPVHGEYRHLEAHRRLGISLGMESQEVFRLEDGDVLELTASSAEVVGKVQHGRIYVDGKGVGDVGEVVLRDRKYLGEDGMVVVALVINHETGEVLSGPDIFSRGFVYEGESAALLDEAKRLVSDALAATAAEEREDLKTAEATVKKELRRFFKQRTERYPMILPVIMEV